MALPAITMSGNLVADPEMRFTQSGAEVVKLRVASQARYFDRQANEWKDGDTCFLDVEIWREQAGNIVESLERGMRVTVVGELRQRAYETKEGEKRSVYEVINAEVSLSFLNQQAKVTRIRRNQDGGAPAAAPASTPAPAAAAPAAPAPAAAAAAAPAAAAAAPAAGGVGTMLDEPPF